MAIISKDIPVVGKQYNHYDDGKIRPSRHSVVEIIDVKPYNKVDSTIKSAIRKEQDRCDWLYTATTDYVVFGKDTRDNMYVYIRTIDGGWFSIDINNRWFNSGELDIDHTLTDSVIEALHEGAFTYSPEEVEQILSELV